LPLRFFLLILAVAAAFVLSLMNGSVAIPAGDVGAVLAGGEAAKASWERIVVDSRLPKAWTALLAGAALAVSGLLMQTLFRNPLAGPYVLGISAGASLAVAFVILAGGSFALSGGGGGVGLVAAASAGAGTVLLLVVLVARRVTNLTLLILGVLFGYATSALVTILIHFSLAERIQAYLAWTFGSFGGVTRGELRVLVPVLLAGLGLAFLQAKPLNALVLGERSAASLGVAVGRTRAAVLVATALLAGTVTAFCGPVGFLGVAVPHLARGFFHSGDHRLLLPGTALLGGLVALVADLGAQLPGSTNVLPLNAVTALVGAPVIAAVVLRRRPETSGAR
jgi:iron complex transport system permease protein